MLDKICKINEHEIYLLNKVENIKIKYFSDLHFTYNFDDRKLDTILSYMNSSFCDYVCCGGDIIDSTNYIRESRIAQKKLLKLLEEISIYRKTFISCGNYDFMKHSDNKCDYDYFQNFCKEINEIPNIQVSCFDPYYEDDKVIIYMPELDFEFYQNDKNEENIDELINKLNKDKEYSKGLYNSKTKIMLINFPYLLTDDRIIKLIKEFDIIISGQMHKGLMHGLDNIINNKGFVSSYLKPFSHNARGVKFLNYNGKQIILIFSGGITKLSSDSFIKRNLNRLYPMDFEEVNVLTKKYPTYNK